ncbi:MAG: PAS domain-containing protein [Desulfobacterales bacterium]|nr:PAS domain-containing protein [Desulfobacterales bacterium]
MRERLIREKVWRLRAAVAELFEEQIDDIFSILKIEIDQEIVQELRERIGILMLGEIVDDTPVTPYVTVWEEGRQEIFHAYLSPRIKDLLGYSVEEVRKIGYRNIVGGEILSYFKEENNIKERVIPTDDALEKRKMGFLGNRGWEGYYKIEKKNGAVIWVIDKATITRYRNTKTDSIICISGGHLLETTGILKGREGGDGQRIVND